MKKNIVINMFIVLGSLQLAAAENLWISTLDGKKAEDENQKILTLYQAVRTTETAYIAETFIASEAKKNETNAMHAFQNVMNKIEQAHSLKTRPDCSSVTQQIQVAMDYMKALKVMHGIHNTTVARCQTLEDFAMNTPESMKTKSDVQASINLLNVTYQRIQNHLASRNGTVYSKALRACPGSNVTEQAYNVSLKEQF